jgi:adenine phosphoribosyltransferase
VRDLAAFPKPGVGFKHLPPLLGDPEALAAAVDGIAEHFSAHQIDKVVGIEARGFVLAAPVAVRLGAGFVPVRKVGKLPWDTHKVEYDLEYGTDELEVHADAVLPGQRAIVVDDVIATGGTAVAACRLIELLGGEVAGCGFLIDIAFLGGAGKLAGRDVVSLITYE